MAFQVDSLLVTNTGKVEESQNQQHKRLSEALGRVSESLRVNSALVRRIIKDENLWMISKEVGRRSKTNISIMYINGVAEQNVVDEVCNRMDRIDIDGIMESANIEEFIQDSQLTVFPTVFNTERPDTVAAGLLEGRIAILVDGTPFVLMVPALFTEFFQSFRRLLSTYSDG